MIRRVYFYSNKTLDFRFAQNIEDFIVDELPVKFSNAGNFLVLKIEKQNCDTRVACEKIAQFLCYFADEKEGYSVRIQGCSQSYVQEGHFFQHLAIPYDILYNSGVLASEEKEKIELFYF